jgi:hypothetical protein
MSGRLRPVPLLLSLLLFLTAEQLALARGQGAAGTAVICTGAGVLTVALDAAGRPEGPPRACPDGVLSVAGTAVPPAVAGMVLSAFLRELPDAAVAAGPILPRVRPPVRGPPGAV